MSWLTILSLAVGLALDAFAVAIAVGLSLPRVTKRHIFRLAWHLGLFQFLMPVIGWSAGRTVSAQIAAYDHWVAFGLLAVIGGKMLCDAFRHEPAKLETDPTRGLMLIALSVATSIDALAVGLSMAFLEVAIWLPSVVIGLVAGFLTVIGICFGSRLGASAGRWARAAGGTVLLLIGVRILVIHLSA